jgi:hypothetical protein
MADMPWREAILTALQEAGTPIYCAEIASTALKSPKPLRRPSAMDVRRAAGRFCRPKGTRAPVYVDVRIPAPTERLRTKMPEGGEC